LAVAGDPIRVGAARFGVSPSYVSKARSRLRKTGETTPGPQHNQVRPRLAPLYDALRARVAEWAGATIAELRAWVAREHGTAVSHAVLWKSLAQLGLTRKKRLRAAEQDRADIAEARAAWAALTAELDITRLVFLDEAWATTNMARTHGRAPRGQRLVAAVPHGHWQTTTVLCGLRHDGVVAPLVLDGAIDGPSFLAWVEQFLAPTPAPGDIVVADNLSSHKVAGVRQAIEARGASLRFLPSHSPDLNPIELLFSKLQRLLRSAAARTVDALWTAIGQLLDQFDPTECANYLQHCGYAHSGR
jgi:transposase